MAVLQFRDLLLYYTCVFLFSATFSGAIPTNGTVSEAHGEEVYCSPAHWYDVVWFYFTNYLLHALSVRSLPGENAIQSTVFKFCCLLVPYTGVRRGLCLVSRASNLAANDLQAAARATALCMVVRLPDWRPKEGDSIPDCYIEVENDASSEKAKEERVIGLSVIGEKLRRKSNFSAFDIQKSDSNRHQTVQHGEEVVLKTIDLYTPPAPRGLIAKLAKLLIETKRFHSRPPTMNMVDKPNVKIHGLCKLSRGYGLSYVPEDMKVYSRVKAQGRLSFSRILGTNDVPDMKLASTHDIPRVMFSLLQTISGGYALYKARGSQIDRYGYAAFGLTVLPFMMVSVINLIGSLLTSEYEVIYLVHSTIMDEMTSRGGVCDGIVGTIEEPASEQFAFSPDEERVQASGQTMLFNRVGETLHCHESSDELGRTDIRLSEENHAYPPAKSEWKIGAWLVRKCRRSEPTSTERGSLEVQTPCRFLCVPSHSNFTRLSPAWYQALLNTLAIVLLILALGVPYLIIGVLSGFRLNQSTSQQRTFALNWLICGQIHGYVVSNVEMMTGKRRALHGFVITFIGYGTYCLCGLVMVAQEMIEFGTCKAL